jgi:hypothetical protein
LGFERKTAVALSLLFALAACGGSGESSGIVPVSGSADTLPVSQTAPDASTMSTATVTPAPSSTVTLGGYTGGDTTYHPHNSGDSYEYSEDVAITFPVVAKGNFAYTISGSNGTTPPSSVTNWLQYGKRPVITVRKVPGVTYTLRVTQPMAFTAKFTTAASPTIPAPSRPTIGQPYRYGTLEHPFPFSIGSMSCSAGKCTLAASSLQQIQLLCNAHVRFVRIDYNAAQILDNGTTLYSQPNFANEDAIMDQLAKCGITELPIIEQYAAGAILTTGGNSSEPMQFASSTVSANSKHLPGYADFARDVVKHIMQKYPQITRVELFNEPNNQGWGNFPVNGNYGQIDRSGAEASVYMKAAYAAIKAVDPKMTVVGPALADGGTTTDPRKFLPVMISNGCRPGTCYDVLSVHNYDWENPTLAKAPSYMNRFNIYQTLQQELAQAGYAGVHVMLTEWGYSTVMQYNGFDPKVQAQYLALGFNAMLSDPTVDGIVYVNMYNPNSDFWGNTALTTQAYTVKPAYATYSKFAGY